MASVNRSGGYSVWDSSNNPAPNFTGDDADSLYFECRDNNYSHEQAISYVKTNGALPNWNQPLATDYQGLPDAQHSFNPNAGRRNFDRMVSPSVQQHAESSAAGAANATQENNLNTPLPLGVTRQIKKAGGGNKVDRVAYYAKSTNDRCQESFGVGRNYTESQARAAAIAARRSMDAGAWVPKSQR